ncbi:MAG: sigma 54-interacting transcriptional regulator, partial [Planctomycetota bacterium]
PGTNVLAIHGLNVTDSSSDMLMRPRLRSVTTPNLSDVGFFQVATPGAANLTPKRDGFVEPVEFSVERGFYDDAFSLRLATATPAAEIYFTTDGSDPTPDNGVLYTSPILIDKTTVLKATGFRDDYFESGEVAHSYLFVNDIIRQNYQATLDAGFPTSWGGVSPDYGMDPDVIGLFDSNGNSLGGDNFGGAYADIIKDSLTAIPTLSIVMPNEDLFGIDGIYTNSLGEGTDWERETSFELIHADGTDGFQVNAGIRMQGGAFRRHDLSRKHSMRLLFKSDYGPTKLEFPFFGDSAVDRFDTITLRMESNDGWAWSGAGSQALYARDAFGSQTHLALGQHSPHNNRMHVYINGIYWGLYNPVERPDASFSAAYYGGDKDQWDAFNDGRTIDGSSTSWNTFVSLSQAVDNAGTPAAKWAAYQRIQGRNPDGTDNPNLEQYLDVNNYIDYLLVNFFMGNQDWPHRNWYASRLRGPDSTGFKFHMWDAETTMGLNSDVNTNRLGADVEAAEPYRYLRNYEAFQLRFADRAHRALFNDGALTRDATLDRMQRILAEVEPGIVAESARWGDQHRSSPYTAANWTTEGNRVLVSFLNRRSPIFLDQLRAAGLYSSVTAPRFAQHGGTVSRRYLLTIFVPGGNGEHLGYIEVITESESASPLASNKALVGESEPFQKMMESVYRVAPTNVSVLLEGESGTGKELIAKAIHDASERRLGKFVVLECSGINENLFESELFGYRKGAFTGARSDREGLAASASGGTLFLDEVGDIPINLQVKLLRLLETGSFRP